MNHEIKHDKRIDSIFTGSFLSTFPSRLPQNRELPTHCIPWKKLFKTLNLKIYKLPWFWVVTFKDFFSHV